MLPFLPRLSAVALPSVMLSSRWGPGQVRWGQEQHMWAQSSLSVSHEVHVLTERDPASVQARNSASLRFISSVWKKLSPSLGSILLHLWQAVSQEVVCIFISAVSFFLYLKLVPLEHLLKMNYQSLGSSLNADMWLLEIIFALCIWVTLKTLPTHTLVLACMHIYARVQASANLS